MKYNVGFFVASARHRRRAGRHDQQLFRTPSSVRHADEVLLRHQVRRHRPPRRLEARGQTLESFFIYFPNCAHTSMFAS